LVGNKIMFPPAITNPTSHINNTLSFTPRKNIKTRGYIGKIDAYLLDEPKNTLRLL